MKKRCAKMRVLRVQLTFRLLQIYIGLKNGYVQCFDVTGGRFTGQFDATGGVGQLVGVEKHKKLLVFYKSPLISWFTNFQHFNNLY